MSGVIIQGDSTGSVTLQVPAAAGSTVINLPNVSMNIGQGGGNVSTNTAFGASALAANTTGATNTAVGNTALQANTTGINNSALGHAALVANTTGSENSAYGSTALVSNTTGGSNTAVGRAALYSNTTASYNTAVGYQAAYSYAGGNGGNTALGYQALTAAGSTANANYNNTMVGGYAGSSLNGTSAYTGIYNTFVGFGAGGSVTTGSKNTILGVYNGNQGGLDIRTASNYIVLSDGDGNPRGVFDGSGNLLVGTTSTTGSGKVNMAFASGSNGFSAVSTDNTTNASFMQMYANGSFCGNITRVGTTSAVLYGSASDYRLKESIKPMIGALEKVAQLKPVSYIWKENGSEAEGFIAHELQAVIPDAVSGEKDAVDADGIPVYQSIDTSFLVATLTAAIQELNAKVEALDARCTTQAAEIAALKGQ